MPSKENVSKLPLKITKPYLPPTSGAPIEPESICYKSLIFFSSAISFPAYVKVFAAIEINISSPFPHLALQRRHNVEMTHRGGTDAIRGRDGERED